MDYAIGDIHGCYKTLQVLIQKINAISGDNTFYFLGDYIDRGPYSKQVLDYLIELKQNSNTVNIIRGNHEQMMLNTYHHGKLDDYKLWKQNGSEQTCKDFNIPQGVLNIKEYIPSRYIDFIESLPHYIETNNYFLVHGGFNFQCSNPFSDFESMLWTRYNDYDEQFTKGKTIIHGHTTIPIKEIIENLKNKTKILSIDSGCVYKQIPFLGYLSALNLNTMELISVENIDF